MIVTVDGVAREMTPAELQLVTGMVVAAPVPATISRRQFAQILAADGRITQDEALAWAARGDLPDAIEAIIGQLPEAERFAARMQLSGASFERAHPRVAELGAVEGYDAAGLDDLWRRAAALS